MLREWAARNDVSIDHVAFVGNDINDVECMNAVGTSIAVADAHPTAIEAANLVLSAIGGRGAIREVADMIISAD